MKRLKDPDLHKLFRNPNEYNENFKIMVHIQFPNGVQAWHLVEDPKDSLHLR